MNQINRQLRLKQRPEGHFKTEDFELVTEPLPELNEGEMLVRVIYLSLDPTQRVWAQTDSYLPAVKLGAVMRSFGLGIVEASQHPQFQVGDMVTGITGWQTHLISDGKGLSKLPRLPDVPLDAYLGPLGMTGITAYFGLLDVGQPKTGEMLVVSAAAGAVGSVVCQIGKLKGLRVVGIAGHDDKLTWLAELGVDAGINYKTQNVFRELRKHAPDGVDVYFENVGGPILDAVLPHLNIGARVPLCGYISRYADADPQPGIQNLAVLVSRRARIQGFLVLDYYPRAEEALRELSGWLLDGKLHYRSEIHEGLENTPTVINRLFTGENTGKLLVQVGDADSQ
jgi:NADPH-dependent curcumin reductase CurA